MPALLLSLCALVVAAIVVTPVAHAQRSTEVQQPTQGQRTEPTTPQQSAQCQNHDRPPPPIDTSEEPKPGEPTPPPLAVPEEPVGGTRMGECGLVHPEGAAELPGGVTSASWVISNIDSGAVIAAKDPHARERPASLIKVLLAIVVIRELRPDKTVSGTQADADQEGTKVGVGPGGEYTVKQLLQALVMRSGNDAAHALAVQLGGVPEALAKMNTLAKELGALDTRAATPSGLDGPGMSTSSYDLSLIFRAAMKHKEFAEAVATRSIDFPGYGKKPGYKVTNDNPLLRTYEGFIGGKTGFTDDARHTYLGSAKRGDVRLAVVLLRGERNPAPLADQAAELLDYGFAVAKSSAKPMGQLVDHAPEVQPKPDSNRGGSTTGESGGDDAAPAPVADTQRSAFGNYGAPLVIVAGAGVLVAFALWIRSKRARAARAARSALM